MTAIQDAVAALTAEVEKVDADFVAVTTLITLEAAKIKDLIDQVAALKDAGVDPTTVDALTAKLKASTDTIEKVLADNAPPAAPVAVAVAPVVDPAPVVEPATTVPAV